MLKVAVQNLGDVTIFRCKGRIVFGHADRLSTAISRNPPLRIAVLDLAEATAIDAAGIGMLVSLRKWAKASDVRLKLMNLTPKIEDLLELTQLKSAFEICSVPEMLGWLCRAFEQSQFVNVDEAVHGSDGVLDDGEPVLAQRA